jgi:hypothetical protein
MMNRVLVVFFSVLLAVPALAQEPNQNEEMQSIRTYCMKDVKRLCPSVQPGEGRIKKCLMEHKDDMSVGCAKALQSMQKKEG